MQYAAQVTPKLFCLVSVVLQPHFTESERNKFYWKKTIFIIWNG